MIYLMLTDRQKTIISDLLSSVQVKPGQSGLLAEVEQILELLKTPVNNPKESSQEPPQEVIAPST